MPDCQNVCPPTQATKFPPRSHHASQNNAPHVERSGGTSPAEQISNPNNQTSPAQTPRKRSKPPPTASQPRPTSQPPSLGPVFLQSSSWIRRGGSQTRPCQSTGRVPISSRRLRYQLRRCRIRNLAKRFLPDACLPAAFPRHTRQPRRGICRDAISNSRKHRHIARTVAIR